MPSPFVVGLLLLLGLGLTSLSTFTTAFSRRWGERLGQSVTLILRVGLGMPMWILALMLAVRVPGPRLIPETTAVNVLAGLSIGAGAGIILWALPAIGRRALAPSVSDSLVVSGPYVYVRHPVYSGCLLEFLGLAAAFPTPVFVLACLVSCCWLPLQARLEERDLLQRIPSYADTMRGVPRLIPRLHPTGDR